MCCQEEKTKMSKTERIKTKDKEATAKLQPGCKQTKKVTNQTGTKRMIYENGIRQEI